jgi:putative DNA primase/helicase
MQQQFSEFARSLGLIIDYVIDDGRWHRTKTVDHVHKKNGSYVFDGRTGAVQNWATMSEPLTWRPDREYKTPKIDRAGIARRQAQARRDLVKATQAAREFYIGCSPLRGGHPYLESHQLTMTGCYGLKIDGAGWLVVPVLLDENVMSVQRISPDGEKKFWHGASVKGGSYLIERKGSQLTVLCEGLATGLAIFAAVPVTRIIVAFNSGNLSKVHIARRSGLVVVAADNDHETAERIGHNPGLDAARAAADALGCGVAMPSGIRGTDWSDYRAERLAQLIAERPRAREWDCRRVVDSEISSAMMRNAAFLRKRNHTHLPLNKCTIMQQEYNTTL